MARTDRTGTCEDFGVRSRFLVHWQKELRYTCRKITLQLYFSRMHRTVQPLPSRLVQATRLVCRCLCLAFYLSVGVHAEDVTVFAAASLTDALKAAAQVHEKASGDKVRFNFAASSLLARQIEEGAPADLFFSADMAKMDALEKFNLLKPGTRRNRLSNQLVIIVPHDSTLKLKTPGDLVQKDMHHLILADPKTVPAGIYARDYLTKQRLWTELQSRAIPVDNVRAVLATLEAGNGDAGIVYKTDALLSKQVRTVYEVPQTETPEICYPVAVLKAAPHPAAAQRFRDFLESTNATEVFKQHGFIVLP